MDVQRRRVNYDDLAQLPEDGRRYELYDGKIFVVPSPLPRHQIVGQRLWWVLDEYARRTHGLAIISPVDIVFSEYDVLQPDIVFFRADQARLLSLDAPIRCVPDLAVEILSPSTAANDRGRKLRMLQRYRVGEYWIVDPVAERIEVFVLAGPEYELIEMVAGDRHVRSRALPELKLQAAAVFPR